MVMPNPLLKLLRVSVKRNGEDKNTIEFLKKILINGHWKSLRYLRKTLWKRCKYANYCSLFI